jgi:hypothetical protein
VRDLRLAGGKKAAADLVGQLREGYVSLYDPLTDLDKSALYDRAVLGERST